MYIRCLWLDCILDWCDEKAEATVRSSTEVIVDRFGIETEANDKSVGGLKGWCANDWVEIGFGEELSQ